jgi:uncharacterized protein YecE (DUF72 family)
MPFERDKAKQSLAALVGKGVYLGTSSWKYAGWRGQLYDQSRYVWRRRFSESRFERLCLTEYAEVFRTVCVDGSYYQFPDRRLLEGLVSQVPDDFLFAFKVTDDITIKTFPKLARFGVRAGKPNKSFLSPELFESAFLGPFASFKKSVGLFIFEFSHFYPTDFSRGREFVAALDRFLDQLPEGWRYGVEIRNRTFLHPDYFASLKHHGVAHVFNSWYDMPPVSEQLALPGSHTSPHFCSARFQLKPGRKYAEAVALFSPYNRVKEVYPEGRAAAATMIKQALSSGARSKAFIYVNNRFEGNALETIGAILDEV